MPTMPTMPTGRARAIAAAGLGPLWRRRESDRFEPHEGGLSADIGHGAVDPAARSAAIAMLERPALATMIESCTACGLCRSRTHAVYGAGLEAPRWFIVGDAPDAADDRDAAPYVGSPGRLLDGMLAAVGLGRDRTFVTNVVKCRPAADRPPADDEMAACRPYLMRQIALAAPRVVVALGDSAVASLFGADRPLSKLRGAPHAVSIDGSTVPVVVTHAPAALMRSGIEKAEAWADLCLARRIADGVQPLPAQLGLVSDETPG